MRRYIFAGGGTAGHLFPGLAVAERLAQQAPHARLTFVGSGKAFEAREVHAAGFEHVALRCRPAPRRLLDVVPSLVDNVAGYWAARRLLAEEPCAVVIGLGGYASVPMARAALHARVPLVLLEQNVVPGRATRWLAPRATMVCLAFAAAREHLAPRTRVLVTGTPLRRGFERFDTPEYEALFESGVIDRAVRGDECGLGGLEACPTAARRQLLVLGGSGGARSLNENVPRALHHLRRELAGWTIVHQSGPADVDATTELYRKLALDARVEPFLREMPRELAQSGLVVARAGGTTLAELTAAGVPGVLLPYPHATDDHQGRNAQVAVDAGGCLALDERGIDGRPFEQLAGMLALLLRDAGRRAAMAGAMRSLANLPAATQVTALIRELALTRWLKTRRQGVAV